MRQAKEEGYVTFVLPGAGIVDRPSFFAGVRETCPLDPPVLGSNSWEALSDSLWEGFHSCAAQRIAILWPGAAAMASSAPADFEIALDLFADLVRSLADRGSTCQPAKAVTVLVGDPGGTPQLGPARPPRPGEF